MLNLSLEQVMQYAKDYKAVPVAKECLADMLTPLAFLDNVRRSSHNYFLLESIEGGEHWAILATLIECCKLAAVEPKAYLTDVLTRLVNGHLQSRLDELTPWSWKAAQDQS